MIRLAVVLCLWAGLVSAQSFPALYDVTGVSEGDVLNVRTGPDAATEIVGSLAPGAIGIEVVEEADGWGRVNIDEASGWASLTYLTRQPGQEDAALPPRLRCGGTEPFWSLVTTGEEVILDEMATNRTRSWPQSQTLRADGRIEPYAIIGPEGEPVAIVSRTACSDGMSDRAFGLRLEVLVRDEDPYLLSGCCSIEGN